MQAGVWVRVYPDGARSVLTLKDDNTFTDEQLFPHNGPSVFLARKGS